MYFFYFLFFLINGKQILSFSSNSIKNHSKFSVEYIKTRIKPNECPKLCLISTTANIFKHIREHPRGGICSTNTMATSGRTTPPQRRLPPFGDQLLSQRHKIVSIKLNNPLDPSCPRNVCDSEEKQSGGARAAPGSTQRTSERQSYAVNGWSGPVSTEDPVSLLLAAV